LLEEGWPAMRWNRHLRRSTWILLTACLAQALPARGGDLVWEIVEAWSAEGLEPAVERLAAQGYTVQAVVLEASEPTLLMSREGWRARPRAAFYRVLGRGKAAEVDSLAAAGWQLHRAGVTRAREAVVVLSRGDAERSKGSLRSLELTGAGTAELERLYSEGLVVVAALGGGKSDWLLLDRPKAPAAAVDREMRLVSAKGTAPMTALLDPLASQGFAVDTLWTRGGGGFSLAGTKEVVAVVSRPRASGQERARPAAHTRLEVGTEPSHDGTLIGVASYGRELVFAVRDARRKSYDSRSISLPRGDDGKELPAWQRTVALREQLQSFAWHPVEQAWFRWDGAAPSALILIEPQSLPTSTLGRAEAHQRGRVPVPSGATALPADGGEPVAAWRAQYDATARRDVKRAKSLWTGEMLARWEENVKTFKAPFGMGFSEKELFSSRADDLPTDPEIVGGWQKGDEAMVRIEATAEGIRSVSDVTLRREAGVWKVAVEASWRALD
jgi:hypothetical protein